MITSSELVDKGFRYHSKNQYVIYGIFENGTGKFNEDFSATDNLQVCGIYNVKKQNYEFYLNVPIKCQKDLDCYQIMFNCFKKLIGE